MKKFLALTLALMMLFSLTACGSDTTPPADDGGEPQQQKQSNTPDTNEPDDGGGDAQTPDESEEATPDNTPVPDAGEEDAADAEALPTSGLPIGWPDNDYTKLVPAPDCGGKVLTSGEIGTLFAIELKWSMEQGLTYAQLLQDAGFGEDCVEKYEQYGYIDRTYNGVNVQLLDVFGAASLSIMPVETE